MAVTVTPSQFTLVNFESADIVRVAEHLRDEIGLPADLEIRIEVNEQSPTGRISTTSADPLVVTVEGGAFENPKKIRSLSEPNVADVLGVLFEQASDRLDPDFGAPDPDAEITLAHRVAWDITAVGRLDRLGHRVQWQRRLYQFRNRHGFSDASDAAFEQLWARRPASWQELVSISDDARSTSLRS
jgi:hypothetical protein